HLTRLCGGRWLTRLLPSEALCVRARRQALPDLPHDHPPADSGPALDVLLRDLPEVAHRILSGMAATMSELAIAHLSTVDPILGGVIRAVGPSTLIVEPDCAPFQTLAQAIAHQQLNGTAANTILGRFIRSCGTDGLFPTPQAVLAAPEATLRTLGDEEIITRLTQVRGIGRWTVEMMLMFRLGRPDILPVDDFGVRNG